MSSTPHAPCAACKCRRQKCTQECIFAPYFPPENPHKFENVHKVFGASNVAKILNDLPPHHRADAANSLDYEAQCRIHDPIYGCVSLIASLQHRFNQVTDDLDLAKNELATYMGAYPQQQQQHNDGMLDFINDFNQMARMQPSNYDQGETSHQIQAHALFQSNPQYYPPPQWAENALLGEQVQSNPQYYPQQTGEK